MLRPLRLALRVASYAALILFVGGVASIVLISETGVCPRFDEGAVECTSPIYETIGGIGLLVVFGSVFTVLPALLALCGLVFLVRDARGVLRRREPRSGWKR